MKILVADDSLATRTALRMILSKWGYEMVEADDGRPAWEILQGENPPRIAILDWNMPEVDGVKVCKMLMDQEDRPFIYTILLTSMDAKEDLIFALENGAHVFLGKPVDSALLQSYIRVGTRLVEAEDNSRRVASQMESLANERAQELVHAERLATLGTLAAGVAHEIYNPVGYIKGTAQTLGWAWPALEKVLRAAIESGSADADSIEQALSLFPEELKGIGDACLRITKIVEQLKHFSKRDTADWEYVSIHDCIETAMMLCRSRLKYNLDIQKDFADSLPPVRMHRQQIEQVFVNLFSNAVDAMQSDRIDIVSVPRGLLAVRTWLEDAAVCVEVRDNGPGIDEGADNSIWKAFYTSKGGGKGTGLGLSISKGILDEHDGVIQASNHPGGGACFRISLPVVPDVGGESTDGETT